MFKNMINECIIRFDLKAESPISIRSGDKLELDPSLPDNQFIRSWHNGEQSVVIPGSSIKGVFRSRAEKYMKDSCDVFSNKCFREINRKRLAAAKEKYNESCPACKLFGNMSLRSRIDFRDAFPVKDTVKMATRHNVGIDRAKGSAKNGALFEPEVLEEGTFEVEIVIKNFFLWQLKVIMQVFNDINEGFVTFGGVTSRGFGKMSAAISSIKIREYGKGEPGEFYKEKVISLDELAAKVRPIELKDSELEKDGWDNEYIL
ncbi:MAG: CRISPR-associated RAMP protein Csx7 [Clostridia bacterium]|nr:CRISPR-associated RAMP protein Csx7 [Clostridia bacterium]